MPAASASKHRLQGRDRTLCARPRPRLGQIKMLGRQELSSRAMSHPRSPTRQLALWSWPISRMASFSMPDGSEQVTAPQRPPRSFASWTPCASTRAPSRSKTDQRGAPGCRLRDTELVAEVEFRGWTADAHLRHAAFRGLREDKPAEEIVREGETSASAEPKAETSVRNVKLTHPDGSTGRMPA